MPYDLGVISLIKSNIPWFKDPSKREIPETLQVNAQRTSKDILEPSRPYPKRYFQSVQDAKRNRFSVGSLLSIRKRRWFDEDELRSADIENEDRYVLTVASKITTMLS